MGTLKVLMLALELLSRANRLARKLVQTSVGEWEPEKELGWAFLARKMVQKWALQWVRKLDER